MNFYSNINMNNGSTIKVPIPNEVDDVVNKQYVDDLLNKVNKSYIEEIILDNTTKNINHNMNSKDIIVSLIEIDTGNDIIADIKRIDENNISITAELSDSVKAKVMIIGLTNSLIQDVTPDTLNVYTKDQVDELLIKQIPPPLVWNPSMFILKNKH